MPRQSARKSVCRHVAEGLGLQLGRDYVRVCMGEDGFGPMIDGAPLQPLLCVAAPAATAVIRRSSAVAVPSGLSPPSCCKW